jgi:hypothetical protein
MKNKASVNAPCFEFLILHFTFLNFQNFLAGNTRNYCTFAPRVKTRFFYVPTLLVGVFLKAII